MLPAVGEKECLVGRPNVGDRARFDQLVDEMFQRGWLTNNGVLVQRLERELAEFVGVRHCLLVSNATVGLQIAARALELRGDVVMPAFTFAATAHAFHWVGLRPVFADIDPSTHLVDPGSVADRMTRNTSAIVGVHLWGQVCDVERLEEIAARHRAVVLYDAAHAFGCGQFGRAAGSFGACEVFSFHATKFFNTFEGGAITTNDDLLADRIRSVRNFGFRDTGEESPWGTNGKMPEVCAAMGIANLAHLPRFVEVNYAHHRRYREGLAGLPGIRLLDYSHQERSNWQYVVLEVDAGLFGTSRDGLLEYLASHRIHGRPYFYPGCHRLEPYRSAAGADGSSLPHTDRLCQRTLCLPTGTGVDAADVARICDQIQKCRDAAWEKRAA